MKLNHDNPDGLLIVNDEINERVCAGKHSVFSKYKEKHKIFIETGTHLGGGIANAFAVGFEKMHSAEITPEYHEYAKNRWKSKSNVVLYLGEGYDMLKKLLPSIEEPVFFWLDSHFNNAAPTYAELEIIKNHKINTHTISIDDIPLYFDRDNIENTLLNINPNYKFYYEPTVHGEKGILIAKND